MKDDWFKVDRQGLAKIVMRRGAAFILYELLQNCWDTSATRVTVTVASVPGRPLAEVEIVDDDPDGFKDLAHAYVLYTESDKKGDPTKRGFMNLGEKLVLALAEEARITSTRGTVHFGPEGRTSGRTRSGGGTVFWARMRLTKAQVTEMVEAARLAVPPHDCHTTINGEPLATPKVKYIIEATLPTMIADAEGVMRPTRRKTTVIVYDLPGPGRILELGIPVCETGDPWVIDVQQKVPLNADRDNVTPAYLRELRVLLVNSMAKEPETSGSQAALAALESPDIEPDAVQRIVRARFGDRVMVADVRDKQANHRAVAAGNVVVPGSAFNAAQWEQIRKAGVMPVTTTKYATQVHDAGPMLPQEDITPEMIRMVRFAQVVASKVLGHDIDVRFRNAPDQPYDANYGDSVLTFNVGRLREGWFVGGPAQAHVLDLLIHELAHDREDNHLSSGYYAACTDIGARIAILALEEPYLFRGD